MSVLRTSKRASTKGSVKTKKEEFKKAYIVPAELGDALRNALLELPMKYSPHLGPLVDALNTCYRSDLTLDVPVDMKSVKSPELIKNTEEEKDDE